MLKLELTEKNVMENAVAATVMLQQLRALAVEIGIDDFGTGYSSFSYRLPINSLKIDSSFVSGMADNQDDTEIIKTIITLAKSLEMNVIAEGDETFEQLSKLRSLECDAAQGLLFFKATDGEAAANLLGLRTQWQATICSMDKSSTTATRATEPAYVVHQPASAALLRAVLKA